MSHSLRETLYEEAQQTDGCAVAFLDGYGIDCAAYVCGDCSLIASRDNDGITYTDEGSCEKLQFDAADRDYDEPEGPSAVSISRTV